VQTIRDALTGSLEIPLFLKAGIGRFAGDEASARASFLVPALLLPVSVRLARLDPEILAHSFEALLIRFTAVTALSLGLYLPAIALAARHLGAADATPRFINAQNWLGLSQVLILSPILLGVAIGRWSWAEVYPFLVFLLMYGYAYGAFAITHILRTNWMLGAALSILGMAVNQFAHFLVYDLLLPF
jgi:hypothetical protein